MMKWFSEMLVSLSVLLLTGGGAFASLMDWHVTPGGTYISAGSYANWKPYGGTNPNTPGSASSGVTNKIAWSIWDGYGPRGNPNHPDTFMDLRDFGGQMFDAKAMYVRNDLNYVYVGIVTGTHPLGFTDPVDPSDPNFYTPGDLAINPDWPNSTAQMVVKFPVLNINAYDVPTTLGAGGTWFVDDNVWGDPVTPLTNCIGETPLPGGTLYSATKTGVRYWDLTTRSFKLIFLLEAAIPMSQLQQLGQAPITFSWGPSCSNDALTVTTTVPVPIPEPVGVSVLLAGCGLACLRRRRRSA